MNLDVMGLLPGATQPEPGAGHPPAGRRTADSPFAVLLASAAPGRAVRAGTPAPVRPPALDVQAAMVQAVARPGAAGPEPEPAAAQPAVVPSPGGAAPAPPALEEPFGTPRAGLEPRLAGDGDGPHPSEEAQEVTESSLLASPAPIPAPAGTGVLLPATPGVTLAGARVAAPAEAPTDQAVPAGLEPVPGQARRRVGGAARPGLVPLTARRGPENTGHAAAQPGQRTAPSALDQAPPGSAGTPPLPAETRLASIAPGHTAPETSAATGAGGEVGTRVASTPAAPPPSVGVQASPARGSASPAAAPGPSVERPAVPAAPSAPSSRPRDAASQPPRTPGQPRPTSPGPQAAPAARAEHPPSAQRQVAGPVTAPTQAPVTTPARPGPAVEARATAVESIPRAAPDAPPQAGPATPPAAAQGQPRGDRGRPDQEGEPRGHLRQPPPPRSAAAPAAHRAMPAPAPAAPAPTLAGQVAARDLGTSARLTQAAHGGAPAREPAERKPTRPTREAEPSGAPLPAHHAATPTPEPGARPAAAPSRAASPPPLPPELPQTLVGGTILPHAAHVRLESATLGDLALHLRVRDGVAHVRVEGDQAAQVAGHGQELQRALAAEGLKLGRLEVDRPQPQAAPAAPSPHAAADQQLPQGHGERPEREEPAFHAHAQPAPGRRPAGRTTAHHVEA